jgi:hypothetical protein
MAGQSQHQNKRRRGQQAIISCTFHRFISQ